MGYKDRTKPRTGKELVMYAFGIFMLIFYLVMAYIFLFSKFLTENLSPTVRYIMGGIFLVYGIFRLYRQIRISKASTYGTYENEN